MKVRITICMSLLCVLRVDGSDCDKNFGTCLRIASIASDQSQCIDGIRLIVSGTVAGQRYDVFYSDTFSPPVWGVAERGIVAPGEALTWIDCGATNRISPFSGILQIPYRGSRRIGEPIRFWQSAEAV
jgi:hypothetical protein